MVLEHAPRRTRASLPVLPSTRGTRGREARKRGPAGPVVRVGRAGYVFSTMVEKTWGVIKGRGQLDLGRISPPAWG